MAIKPYPSFVDKKNIRILDDPENQLRYRLTVPFHKSPELEDWKAVVIMKNPSAAKVDHTAGIYDSDSTINRVITYFYKFQFSEVTVVNLFAKYDTDSSELNHYTDSPLKMVGSKNDFFIQEAINEVKDSQDLIIAAWGGYPQQASPSLKQIYKERIRRVEEILADRTCPLY